MPSLDIGLPPPAPKIFIFLNLSWPGYFLKIKKRVSTASLYLAGRGVCLRYGGRAAQGDGAARVQVLRLHHEQQAPRRRQQPVAVVLRRVRPLDDALGLWTREKDTSQIKTSRKHKEESVFKGPQTSNGIHLRPQYSNLENMLCTLPHMILIYRHSV